MLLRTLGGLHLDRVGDDAASVARPGPKALFLLAYLAHEGPRERRHLAELMWRDVSDPRNGLSTALTRLRRTAPGAVRADPVMVEATIECDDQAFVRACQDGRFEEAAALYRGAYLEGLDLSALPEAEEWMLDVRESLARRLIDALVSLAERALRARDRAAATRWAEQACRHVASSDPDEALLARLHVALVRAGSPLARQVEREAGELGVELDAAPFVPQRLNETLPEGRPTTGLTLPALPSVMNPTFGREDDIARLEAMLRAAEVRIVTLVGPGGVGKTRLAQEVAGRLRAGDAFPDGVAFVALAEARDAATALEAVARGLGLRVAAEHDVAHVLATAFEGKRMLLVLDNVEQVDGLADELARLAAACPATAFLLTSRVPTRMAIERQVPVDVLPVPVSGASRSTASEAASVELFVRRAQAVDPSFGLDETNVEAVATLCRLLDGLPLAIELAAARARLMTPAEMVERLDRRIDLLATPSAAPDARHRTLRDTLDWSFELLSQDERSAFRRLALFTGAFPLEAAERMVASDPVESLRLLEALVDHSLVRVLPGSPRRLTLLATVRTYGRERLDDAGEREAAELARTGYLLTLSEKAAKELTGSEQRSWFARLGELHADFGASLRYLAAAGEVERGLRLASALWRYWVAQGHMLEAESHFERLLGLPLEEHGGTGELAGVRAEALEGYGATLQELGEPRRARARLLEGLGLWERLERPERIATTLNHLSWLTLNLGDVREAEAHAKRALTLHESFGDHRGRAVSINNLGWIALMRGDVQDAAVLLDASLAERARAGDERGVAYARANLAWALRRLGQLERCGGELARAEETLRRLGDDQVLGWARVQGAFLALEHGDATKAVRLALDAVERSRRTGQRSGETEALIALTEALWRQGETGEAVARGKRALALARQLEETFTIARASVALGRALCASGEAEEGDTLLAEAASLHASLGDAGAVAAVEEERAKNRGTSTPGTSRVP
ncbi:MAG: tetratricopeptide repeat protein [Trueperaceae bacterium]